jgi:hypothetical protein
VVISGTRSTVVRQLCGAVDLSIDVDHPASRVRVVGRVSLKRRVRAARPTPSEARLLTVASATDCPNRAPLPVGPPAQNDAARDRQISAGACPPGWWFGSYSRPLYPEPCRGRATSVNPGGTRKSSAALSSRSDWWRADKNGPPTTAAITAAPVTPSTARLVSHAGRSATHSHDSRRFGGRGDPILHVRILPVPRSGCQRGRRYRSLTSRRCTGSAHSAADMRSAIGAAGHDRAPLAALPAPVRLRRTEQRGGCSTARWRSSPVATRASGRR